MHALFVVKVCVPSCSLRFFIQSTCPQLKTLNSFIPFNFIASATPADSKNLRWIFILTRPLRVTSPPKSCLRVIRSTLSR